MEEICVQDARYKPDAYEFVMQALHFTQNRIKKHRHVTGKELLEGIREFVVEQYGPMSMAVLTHWGITKTQDFGNIVFNLVDVGLFLKTEEDCIDDFLGVYDFTDVFELDYFKP